MLWHGGSRIRGDWQATWTLLNEKYTLNPDYRRYSSNEIMANDPEFNIDAKLNGAYVVMGLLYGGGDPLQTITMTMRAGQDSDCNPASASGILSTPSVTTRSRLCLRRTWTKRRSSATPIPPSTT